MAYHMAMARKQVLVQLDDELVERLDRLAIAEGTNRSDLLRRAAWVVLKAADLKEADAKMQAAYRRVPQEAWLIEAAGRLAAETVPEW
jgi:metal-responsive CopG/Arc/MetJ family transcriptional regulator